jgi:ABC-type transport system involved in multi-copper enzyme maturation permease subunit
MKKIWILARATILEALRRKDLYVLLILTAVIIGSAGLTNFFGIHGLQKFLKDISFTVINIFTIIIAVTVTARQLPYELENRTIYPLLAKQISRLHFLLGKYVGALIMSTFTLLVFSTIFLITLVLFQASTDWIFLQAIFLRFLSLALIVALVLCLSLFVTQSANVTISLLFCIGASIISRSITLTYEQLDPLLRTFAAAVYWVVPHLDLFDLSKKVVHGWPPISVPVMIFLTIYAGIYTFVFLTVGLIRFRRRML